MNSSNATPAGTAGRREPAADPYKWASLGVITVFFATLPVLLAVVYLGGASTSEVSTVPGAAGPTMTQTAQAMPGESVFQKACAVCHGPNGDGVPFLGKPLRNSEYVQTHSDEELFALIVNGRAPTDPANTSGVLMPPRGAQSIPDESVHAVVSYLRSMQAEGEPYTPVLAWETKSESGGAPAGTALELTEHAGYQVYVSSCAACHGQGAEGLESLGLPLTTSGFVRGLSDKDLITFIKTGRSSWDENNTTGLDMPSKGGNPAITEDQLQLIVDYLRALQKQTFGA